MKLENQSNKSANKSNIDLMIKKQIDVLDFSPPPVKYWVKSESWKVIKQKIGRADSKVIAWGMAMAATVSLTVAAGLQLNFNNLFNQNSTIEVRYVYNEPSESGIPSKAKEENIQRIDPINSIQPALIANGDPEYLKSTTVSSLNTANEYSGTLDEIANRNAVKRIIDPYFSLGISSPGIQPEIGIDFLIFSKIKKFRVQQIKLGLSTELTQYRNEMKTILTPNHFANLTYENINSKTNKGWSVKTGLLLNSDSNFYTNTTVKLGLSRQFNKWLKFGPQLIFTNNWKEIYPSLTLSLG